MKNIFNEKNIRFVFNLIGKDYKYNSSDEYDEIYNKIIFKCAVDLVWSGILKYNKLTPENYNYWWYETDKPPFKKDNYTFNFADLSLTTKGQLYLALLNSGKYDFIPLSIFLQYYFCITEGQKYDDILEPLLKKGQIKFNFIN